MNIELPYGKYKLPLDIPDKNLLGVIVPKEFIPPRQSELLIKAALQRPLDTDQLSQVIGYGDTIAIVADYYNRPYPTKMLSPLVLEEFRQVGMKIISNLNMLYMLIMHYSKLLLWKGKMPKFWWFPREKSYY